MQPAFFVSGNHAEMVKAPRKAISDCRSRLDLVASMRLFVAPWKQKVDVRQGKTCGVAQGLVQYGVAVFTGHVAMQLHIMEIHVKDMACIRSMLILSVAETS
jgi:hypothetical protein